MRRGVGDWVGRDGGEGCWVVGGRRLATGAANGARCLGGECERGFVEGW